MTKNKYNIKKINDMRKLLLLCFVFYSTSSMFGQLLISETTRVVSKGKMTRYDRGDWAFRINTGGTYLDYDSKTTQWIKNHGAVMAGLEISRNRIFLATDFRVFTVNPRNELRINNKVIPLEAKVNPGKVNLLAGYEFDLSRKTTLSPYAGWLNSVFYVINEDQLGEKYTIPSKSGFTCGVRLNQYFEYSPYYYWGLFVDYNFNISNYNNISAQLGNTFQGFSVGLMCKFWVRSQRTINDAGNNIYF
jgi:hypothetical protein